MAKKTKKAAPRTPTKVLTSVQVDAKLKVLAKRWGVTPAEARHLSLVGFLGRQDALDRYNDKGSKPKAKTAKAGAEAKPARKAGKSKPKVSKVARKAMNGAAQVGA